VDIPIVITIGLVIIACLYIFYKYVRNKYHSSGYLDHLTDNEVKDYLRSTVMKDIEGTGTATTDIPNFQCPKCGCFTVMKYKLSSVTQYKCICERHKCGWENTYV
jgi:predicted RNA-binding Zn-ribbon protein involved in translation (DUF1610 family)